MIPQEDYEEALQLVELLKSRAKKQVFHNNQSMLLTSLVESAVSVLTVKFEEAPPPEYKVSVATMFVGLCLLCWLARSDKVAVHVLTPFLCSRWPTCGQSRRCSGRCAAPSPCSRPSRTRYIARCAPSPPKRFVVVGCSLPLHE